MTLTIEDFDQDIAILFEMSQLQIIIEPENILLIIVSTESFQVELQDKTSKLQLKTFDFGRQILFKYGTKQNIFVLKNTSIVLDTNMEIEIGKNFIGCISALRINDNFPLKNNENMEFSKCNVLQKLTRDLEITTELVTITTTLQNTEDFEPEEFSVFGLLCICLFIFGILFGIYLAIKKYVKRHTGVYNTREDAGEAEALDADTAVLHSKTGHLVEKRQEWFF